MVTNVDRWAAVRLANESEDDWSSPRLTGPFWFSDSSAKPCSNNGDARLTLELSPRAAAQLIKDLADKLQGEFPDAGKFPVGVITVDLVGEMDGQWGEFQALPEDVADKLESGAYLEED